MMLLLLGGVLLQSQAPPPTIGDTIRLTQTVAQPPGHIVRPTDWSPPDPVELLARPTVVVSGDSAEITYRVVIWRPGHHAIDLPGQLLLGPGGTVDSLPGTRVTLDVRSVLPPVPRDSTLAPQPRASLVPRRETSLIPLAICWLAALILLIPLHVWWRRWGKPVPVAPATPVIIDPPLSQWADDGEYRAVANIAAARLRAAVAQRVIAAHPGLDTERLLSALAAARPDWPLRELGELLRALDDARFGQVGSSEVLDLSRSSTEMQERLRREAA
jgi:hypothetical protein